MDYPKKQMGYTVLGLLVSCILAVMLGILAIRLTPIYLKSHTLDKLLQDLTQIPREELILDPKLSVMKRLEKALSLNDITYPTMQEVKIEKNGFTLVVHLVYDESISLFSNLSLLIHFDKVVMVSGYGS